MARRVTPVRMGVATVAAWVVGGVRPPGLFSIIGPGDPGVTKVADVSDGTSNTIAFGEWKMGDFNSAQLSLQDVIDILAKIGRAHV